MEKLLKTLEALALNNEISQAELPEIVGCSYRTIIRQLKLLKALGLAEIKRKEPSIKGKDRHIWTITFQGLMSFISWLPIGIEEKYLDDLARNHKDKWLIFECWEYLTRDPGVKKILINSLSLAASEAAIFKFPSRFRKNYNHFALAKIYEKANLEELIVREVTLKTLMLWPMFQAGGLPPWVFKSENANDPLVKLWRLCLKHPRLRKFIEEQFEYEEKKHQNIKLFRKLLFSKDFLQEAD